MLCVSTARPQTISNNAHAQANAALDARMRTEISSFKGHVSLFAKNLDSGETYALNADDVVATASTIKVAIMVETFARISEGRSKWTDEVVLTPQAKKVYGSGVLQQLSDNLHLTLRDVVTLMIIVSDNAAANLVLDVVTPDAVNARMDSLGLKQTRVLRKIGAGNTPSTFGRSHPDFITRYGTGMTTPREMAGLLEMIERGQIISPAASREMIDVLKRQQLHYGIGRNLQGVEIASKSGALDHLRSDVGIVYTRRGRIAMAVTCNDIPEVDYSYDNAGDLLIARLSQILIDGLGK
ncbi:MAG TPA: serine hydrolase [Pyrinomonadaceae bacterium]|nr:serine hydrolase [Pyrinomonadaceae bacterium]